MNRRTLFRSLGLAAAVGALPKLPAKAAEEPKIIAQPHVEPARVGQAVVGRSLTFHTVTTSSGTNGLMFNILPVSYPVTITNASGLMVTGAGSATAGVPSQFWVT